MTDSRIITPGVDPAPEPATVPEAHFPPVRLHMTNKKVFTAGLDQWQYEEQGVFAKGHFGGASSETLVLIPYQRIEYFEFQPVEA